MPLAPNGAVYDRARLLIRQNGEPLGHLHLKAERGELNDGGIDVDRTVELARARFAGVETAALGESGRTSPAVSVVIGTRNRTDHVVACVEGVLGQEYDGPIEVIVVDNAPSDHLTADAIAERFGHDHRVSYLLEPVQGLSWARNAGLADARHELVAFLSDDIQVDRQWLQAVVRGFERHPDVLCVTGFCPPLYLDTEEQIIFEKTMAWGWRGGFEPRLIGADVEGDRLHPYRLGVGTGANMSFRTDYFRRKGGFDVNLGPGTLARGGEDLDAPVRALLDDGLVAFEPAALGWHADRYDDRTFTTHMFTYGVGLTAFLTSHLLSRETRWRLIKLAPFGALHLFKPAILPDGDDHFDDVALRKTYSLANVAGRFMGPIALARSRSATKRMTTKKALRHRSVAPDGSMITGPEPSLTAPSGARR